MQISENGPDLSSDTNIGSVGRLHSVRRRFGSQYPSWEIGLYAATTKLRPLESPK